mmetsp:Transcript_17154/g.28215  ORF Transcript_17154/g.28215 Transcript_17154/m.28215 type:complete len:528 (-) Transcript_17154:380-1963(-)|eukprot:CAMPEP_0184661732 /NCGR_PEP_ID=MMETSP0308-20130426/39819_1 /TAXON_ID=38269 /ORGANISM="Gloeochaete witrockiana, Strain SAG 46.84" /LENGTH=527 /DNA_ID=CAMNT_0027103243 /DNA_START=174 /DNA_END=1757 /DNA_ORIENTATION=-
MARRAADLLSTFLCDPHQERLPYRTNDTDKQSSIGEILFHKGLYSDVTVRFRTEIFNLHLHILAESASYFEAVLRWNHQHLAEIDLSSLFDDSFSDYIVGKVLHSLYAKDVKTFLKSERLDGMLEFAYVSQVLGYNFGTEEAVQSVKQCINVFNEDDMEAVRSWLDSHEIPPLIDFVSSLSTAMFSHDQLFALLSRSLRRRELRVHVEVAMAENERLGIPHANRSVVDQALRSFAVSSSTEYEYFSRTLQKKVSIRMAVATPGFGWLWKLAMRAFPMDQALDALSVVAFGFSSGDRKCSLPRRFVGKGLKVLAMSLRDITWKLRYESEHGATILPECTVQRLVTMLQALSCEEVYVSGMGEPLALLCVATLDALSSSPLLHSSQSRSLSRSSSASGSISDCAMSHSPLPSFLQIASDAEQSGSSKFVRDVFAVLAICAHYVPNRQWLDQWVSEKIIGSVSRDHDDVSHSLLSAELVRSLAFVFLQSFPVARFPVASNAILLAASRGSHNRVLMALDRHDDGKAAQPL